MSESPPYEAAARTAAEIVNLLDEPQPKPVLFSRVLFLILDAIYATQRSRSLEPSEN